MKRIHKLIVSENTGAPSVFARKLSLSRSQLYNELEVIKELDAPIKYCKKRETFFYETSFELILNYSFKTIKDDESKEIFGGSNFCPILLDGTMISLL
ncbi:hypothetical protein SAMN06265349_102191 [Flavobacterium resistens]|uniref:HTH domain-containing protein n=1 Tax=Flavobacterium resistens TaxID=443612 RepID=A0A521C6Q5_9FLAO|nr:hypothetical protein [Flavobacterium resistens]SMO54360.1 hypothetical protein SAMN06265349_102191 [Flavobacterium resistens]